MANRKYFITGEQVISFGTICMFVGAFLCMLHLIVWFWVPIPDLTIKIGATGILVGFLIAAIGLFLPNNW